MKPFAGTTVGLRLCREGLVLALLACRHRDPWVACADGGDPGFGPVPTRCDTATCQACAATMDRAYRTAPDALRTHFIRASAAAREAFVSFTHPEGTYAFEHCTAGLAHGARCAAYSPGCLTVLAQGLRSADTTLAQRGQLTLAATAACPDARDALVAALTRCEPSPTDPTCTDPGCLACESGHLAALTVVAPEASDAQHGAALRALIDHTPEPVARAIVENLGAPDAPADIETVVVQRGLRGWCFSLVEHSTGLPPFACNATLVRFLQHTDYADSAVAWASVTHSRPEVRGQLVQALLTDLARQGSLPGEMATRIQALPPDGTVTAIQQAMAAAVTPPAVYTALRALLVARGVTDLPPVTQPVPPPAPSAGAVPAGSPGGRLLGPVGGRPTGGA